jgi:hypothetical protein
MDRASLLIKPFLPRLGALLFIILFLSALTLGPRMINIDGDLPRHLLMGKYVLETGAPPVEEIFSYTYENRPYTPHEWLAGVIYYVAYVLLGLSGVVLLGGILLAVTFTMLYQEAISQNVGRIPAFLLMSLGALVTSIHWAIRPHLFTMLFLAIWLILTERLSRGTPVKIWLIPALMVLWANIHGEFIAGFLVLAAHSAGWTWQFLFDRTNTSRKTGRNLLFAFLLSLPASLLSPVGFRTWDTVLGYVTNRYLLSRIVETRPPDFVQATYWPLLIMLALPVFLLITKKAKFTPAQVFLLAGFGLMSLTSARNAHLSGVVFPFVLSGLFSKMAVSQRLEAAEARIAQIETQTGRGRLPIILTVLISLLIITGPAAGFNRFEPSIFPVVAVRWLEDHPPTGRMFNAFDWGGYILLHLWPDQKTFIESQTDVRGEATQKYETVITLQEGWQEIFEAYDIRWAILPPEWPLARELADKGWESVYQDQTAIILLKK